MKASEVLAGARTLYDRIGLAKGMLYDSFHSPTKACLVGACDIAGGWDEAADFVNTILGTERLDVVSWNNREVTTKADVQGVIDAAYILALQEEGHEPEDVL